MSRAAAWIGNWVNYVGCTCVGLWGIMCCMVILQLVLDIHARIAELN